MARPKTLSPSVSIISHYKCQIDQGTIAHGEKVASRRAIAAEWGVSVNTVMKAFATLHADGYVRVKAHRNGGTYAIAPGPRATAATITPEPRATAAA